MAAPDVHLAGIRQLFHALEVATDRPASWTHGVKQQPERTSEPRLTTVGGDDDFFGDPSPQATSIPINSANDGFEIDNESEIEASISLVRRAFYKNALDNISVVVVRFT